MLSFLTTQPPRTTQSHLKEISTEDGRTRMEYFPSNPSSLYAARTHIPPGATIHTPPYHYHKYQIESFTIESGIFKATVEGKDSLITAGNSVSIEPGTYHTFVNGSDTEELVVLTGLDPSERERDEAFFRNLYGYLDDCRKANLKPSLFQICLWLYMFDCYLALPGPRWAAMWVSEWLVWGLGVVIGKGLLGMKETYLEYWDGDASRLHQRMGGEEKKEL